MGGEVGAGDEIIVTGQVRRMQENDSRRVRIVYEKNRWHPVWDYNPRIAGLKEQGDFQILYPRTNGLRPYCRSKSPERWTWQPWQPPAGEFYFAQHEKAFGKLHAGNIVLEPSVKSGASPNKRWAWDRWESVAQALANAGHRLIQVGPKGTRILSGCRLVETESIRQAAAVIANSKLIITHEGALHHVAAAVGTPAVVLFGGYISPEVTGYNSQVNLFTGEGLGCGWRTPCKCCTDAMGRITVEMVVREALRAIN